jgi:type IV pilus assembly protein PilM
MSVGKQQLFYRDHPVFGFDVGRSSVKLMQVQQTPKGSIVTGYGTIAFDPAAIRKGVVVNPEAIIKAAHELIENQMVGTLTTRRVAVSLPNAYSFNRVLELPKMDKKDLASAIELEAGQSIPLPLEELYYDFEVTKNLTADTQEVQLEACPRTIIDSYMGIFEALGLEVAVVESNITSVTRMVVHAEAHDVTTLIVDFGSTACDLSIYDGDTIRITSTIDCSGDAITRLIAQKLGVSEQQAHSIKTRYGIEVSKKQSAILDAVGPELSKLTNEIRKVIRYFGERTSNQSSIGQIIVLGGGANLPGLSSYITDKTRLPARLCAPWNNLSFGKLQPPHELETTLYTTAGGLSLISPKVMGQ